MDDSFVICPHGRETFDEFLLYLNRQYTNIKCTMEIERNEALAFLDVMVKRDDNNKISHIVHPKKIYTDRYVHATFHHHPIHKTSLISTLVRRTEKISDKEYRS